MPWYYYNENNEKIGPVEVREFKQLARQGTITSKTRVENGEGRTGFAENVNGWPFAESTQTNVEDFGMQASSVLLPTGQNPFSNPKPPTGRDPFSKQKPPTGRDPFSKQKPPTGCDNPFQPRRRSFGEIMAATMKATMDFIASMIGLITALALVVLVLLLFWCLLEMAEVIPRTLPYNPFMIPPGLADVKADVEVVNDVPVQEEPLDNPNTSPEPFVEPKDEEQPGGQANGDEIVAPIPEPILPTDPPQPPLDLSKAIPLSEIYRKSGFRDLRDIAAHGSPALKGELDAANQFYNNAQRTAPEFLQRGRDMIASAQEKLNRARAEIAKEVFYADYTYSASLYTEPAQGLSSTNLSINASHGGSGGGVVGDVSFPQTWMDVAMQGAATRNSNSLHLTMRGNLSTIQEIHHNSSRYRVRVWFTNLKPGGTHGYSTDVLKVEISAPTGRGGTPRSGGNSGLPGVGNPPPPPPPSVRGRVTFGDNNVPLTAGTVVFQNNGGRHVGTIGRDGSYTTATGVPPGSYRVSVTTPFVNNQRLIDNKYDRPETSGLTAEVTPTSLSFDFQVDKFVPPVIDLQSRNFNNIDEFARYATNANKEQVFLKDFPYMGASPKIDGDNSSLIMRIETGFTSNRADEVLFSDSLNAVGKVIVEPGENRIISLSVNGDADSIKKLLDRRNFQVLVWFKNFQGNTVRYSADVVKIEIR